MRACIYIMGVSSVWWIQKPIVFAWPNVMVYGSVSIYFLSLLFCTDWEFGKHFKWKTMNAEFTSLHPVASWDLGSAWTSLRSSFNLCSPVRYQKLWELLCPLVPAPPLRFIDFALYQESAIVLRESVAQSRWVSLPWSFLFYGHDF